jgi:hypothetical protein
LVGDQKKNNYDERSAKARLLEAGIWHVGKMGYRKALQLMMKIPSLFKIMHNLIFGCHHGAPPRS